MNSLMPPIAESLLDIAKQIADLADMYIDDFRYGEHAELMEWEAKLLAYGHLLTAFDRDRFLQEEIHDAMDFLSLVTYQIGGAS